MKTKTKKKLRELERRLSALEQAHAPEQGEKVSPPVRAVKDQPQA